MLKFRQLQKAAACLQASMFSQNSMTNSFQFKRQVEQVASAAHTSKASKATAEASVYDTSHVPVEILYQDEHLVVIDKPYGMLSVPGTDARISDAATLRVAQMLAAQEPEKVEAVHRLDMATSGILVIALSSLADANLKLQFQQRQTAKAYYAVVRGQVTRQHQLIEAPLSCDWPLRPRQQVDWVNGRYALTECWVLSYDQALDQTLVKLIPHTGRSHQLRVHLQFIGHPIVGDKFYDDQFRARPHHCLCLHAGFLSFRHPVDGRVLSFEREADFEKDWEIGEFTELSA